MKRQKTVLKAGIIWGRHIGPGVVEKRHQLCKPVSPFPHQVLFGNPYIRKEYVGGVGCAKSHFSMQRIRFISGPVRLDHDNAVAAGAERVSLPQTDNVEVAKK